MRKKLFLILLIPLLIFSFSMLSAQDDDSKKEKPKKRKSTKAAYLTRRKLTAGEMKLVWGNFIPNLGSSDEIEIKRARERLVELKLPVVVHLVNALQTNSMLDPLTDYNRLIAFKTDIRLDLQKWFLRHAPEFKKSDPIRKQIDSILNSDTSKQVRNKVRKIFKILKDNREKVKKPQILNRLRGQAAYAIGEIGDISPGPEVIKLLDDEAIYVKTLVFSSLGLMGRNVPDKFLPKIAKKIYEYLFHPTIKVRSYAWTALRNLDYRQAVPDLLAEFKKAETDYRKRIITQALEGITMQGFRSKLTFWERWWKEVGTGKNPLGVQNPRTKRWSPTGKTSTKTKKTSSKKS